MMRRGRSFSGREKNCCFLSTLSQPDAQGRFANISAASGLDFPDDGRAIGTLDWDMDGDLDVWVTNRNAPRLRLMRNDTKHQNHYVAFRLVGNGTTVNRDAIGARMEIFTVGEPNTIHVKTLRAGDAFLAQSSKWLHFGLGKRSSIKSVRVLWPDGSTEEFGPVASDQRYRITQSSGQVESWPPPSRNLAISPGKPTLPARSAAARTPLVFPLRVPSMSYRDFDGRDRDLPIGKRPMLINLWASWCTPCMAELQELKQRHQEFGDVGLDVIALSVDRLSMGQNGAGEPSLSNADEQIISDMDPLFTTGRATKQVVDTIQFLHDLVIHSRQTLPIPTTILLDDDGRLVAIYKGSLPPDHVFADIKHSKETFVERKTNAAMIDGMAIQHDLLKNVARRSHAYALFQAGFAMRKADRVQEAISYFSDAVAVSPESATTHVYLGDTFREAKRYAEAVSEYQTALRISPDLGGVHFNLANTLQKLGQVVEAVEHYEQAVRVKPGYFEAHTNCAIVLNGLGRVEAAAAHYQEAVRIRPDSAPAQLDLGSALLTLNRLDLAQTHFDQALRLAPKDADAHSGLGKVLVRRKRYAEALPHFESAVRLRPDSATAHDNLGNVLKIMGRLKEAAQEYEAALHIAPDSAETQNNLGAALQAQDRFDEAIAHYRAALEMNPQLAAAHRNWGRALQTQGIFEEAITHFQAAVQVNPDFAKAYYELGQTQLMLQRAKQAVVNLEKAVRLMPNDAAAHRDFGRALIMLGSLDDGIGQYRKSLQLKPNDLQTLNNLAWLLATCEDDRVRDGDQAVTLAERAARLTDNENPLVLDTLAATYAEAGDFEKAARWQTKAIELSPSDRKDDGRAKLELYRSGSPFRERRSGKTNPAGDN